MLFIFVLFGRELVLIAIIEIFLWIQKIYFMFYSI